MITKKNYMRKKICIISNESISDEINNYYCDNLDLKSIPEGLKNIFEVSLVARKSKLKRNHRIKNIQIQLANNIFSFVKNIIEVINKKENTSFLIISITPYTFAAVITLSLFKIKPMLYLRSDGYEEYETKLGIVGKFIYHVMFQIASITSNFISCRKHILRNKNGKIVSPSHLNEKWFKNHKKVNLDEIRLLYVGRIRVEKGIFSFLKIFEKFNSKYFLNIICSSSDHNKVKSTKNINLIGTQTEDELIKFYDNNTIFILPSFTEGHPQVLDEALSRLRPVIIFEEIRHVQRNRKGIFICKRNEEDLKNKINFILRNFPKIQDEIKQNNLPTNQSFLKELEEILKNENF